MTHIQLWQACFRCLQFTLPLVVLGMAVGFAVSIPINYTVDSQAFNVKWYGGAISGLDRLLALRNRTFFTMLFFGGVFFVTGLQIYLNAQRKLDQEHAG